MGSEVREVAIYVFMGGGTAARGSRKFLFSEPQVFALGVQPGAGFLGSVPWARRMLAPEWGDDVRLIDPEERDVTGTGVEVGGRIAWTVPDSGLSLEARVRTLVAHEDSEYGCAKPSRASQRRSETNRRGSCTRWRARHA